MFVFEASVFVLFLGFVCVWSLVRESLAERKYQRAADQLSNLANAFYGRHIAEATAKFGPPLEEVVGSSGRSLYTWKSPPAPGFPRFDRVIILTLTADREGVVRDVEWHRW
jgi:hypothetical protein